MDVAFGDGPCPWQTSSPFTYDPVDARHDFEDEFAHVPWGPGLGPAEASTAASPVYTYDTLFGRKVVQGNGEHMGGLGNTGVVIRMELSLHWLTEDVARDSFAPLQLDAFHVGVGDVPDGRPKSQTRGGIVQRSSRRHVKEASAETTSGRYPGDKGSTGTGRRHLWGWWTITTSHTDECAIQPGTGRSQLADN